MPSNKKQKWAINADFSPQTHDNTETRVIPSKNPKINPVVVKTILDSKRKRFRKSAIRENFNLKPEQ